MDSERKARLETVLEEIERHKYSVDELEEMLLREYKLEGGKLVNHLYKSYGWNLDITINKQLRQYKECKNKKYLSNYFGYFINAFKQDISEELSKISRQS